VGRLLAAKNLARSALSLAGKNVRIVFVMLKLSRSSAILVVLILTAFVLGMGAQPSNRPTPPMPGEEYMFYKIDDFDDGSYEKQPAWWVFDGVNLEIGRVKSHKPKGKRHCLLVTGKATNWYVGGLGAYLGMDAGRFTNLEVDVYGNGKNSGKLKIEIFEDDNANRQIEQDPRRGFNPIFDDKWVYELEIDWQGWKTVSILLSDFKDENPGIGDDIWNPHQENDSGGLIQMQFIVTATKVDGSVDFKIDNIKLVKYIRND